MADLEAPARAAPEPVSLPPHVPPELAIAYEHTLGPNALYDPYTPNWATFENNPPVFFAPPRSLAGGGAGSWVCSRYEDVREVLQNSELYSTEGLFPFQFLVGETWRALPISADPPEHDKYRTLLNPFFSPKAVSQLDSKIHAVVGALIDGFEARGECDAAYEYSRVYPVKVFMGLMGFPDDKFEDFLSWGLAILHNMDDIEKVKWGARSALAYLRSFVEEVRARPADNLTSHIVRGQVEGRSLTEDEIIGILFFLWIGGLDTVASVSTLSFRMLAMNPELQQQLREHPEDHGGAVDEFLRMNPSVNVPRVAKADHVLHGVQIKKGDQITVLITTANFDPAEFEEPRQFRANRSPNRHLTFVSGPHRCLGLYLARRELKIALGEFLRRIPPFRVKPGADLTVMPGLLATPHLPVVWDVTR